jgi:hypothetical protein
MRICKYKQKLLIWRLLISKHSRSRFLAVGYAGWILGSYALPVLGKILFTYCLWLLASVKKTIRAGYEKN